MSMMKKRANQNGFTLIELLMVVLLLSIVVGAVFSQIERAQVRYKVEDQRTDLTQQEREFIDQFTRDLHQTGYPSVNMFAPGVAANNVAVGLLSLTANDVIMEGDVDGDGVVETVEYSYYDGVTPAWPGPGPNPCPCIRRSQLAKGAAGPATNFTQVQNVIGAAFFTAYNASGNTIPLPAANLAQVKSIQITLTTQGTSNDNDSHQSIQVTMTGMARLVNN